MDIVYSKNLTKIYGSDKNTFKALDDVNVEFAKGKFHAIMGPSGSGKSTLMHCWAGLDKATSGNVFLLDTNMSELSQKERTLLRRKRVGFIFQAFNLIPTLSAEENILLPLRLSGTKPDHKWYDSVIESVGLGDKLKNRPSELSGGQQQRVAIARAVVAMPDVVFADEPTGNLDSNSGKLVLDLLTHIVKEYGQTVVMVTHDVNAASATDRAVFLEDGQVSKIVDEPTTKELINELVTIEKD